MLVHRSQNGLIRRMLARECISKNAVVAGYGEAFGDVLSSKQARIWSSYLSNDVQADIEAVCRRVGTLE